MAVKNVSKDSNLDLVKAMGSTSGYDPIPPDQYLFFLDDEDEGQRVLAWVRANTIHKDHRSPFACWPDGKPKTKANLARDCFSGDRGHACRAWDRLEQEGLARCDEQGRLCLCGKVPRQRRRKGDETAACTGSTSISLPSYLIEQIESLPVPERKRATAAFEHSQTFRKKLETDAIQMARIRADQIDDSICSHFGLRKQRPEKPKRVDLRTNGSTWLQMKFLLVPQELEEFVQAAPASCTSSENGVVQAASTFMYYRGTEKTSIASSSEHSPSPPVPDVISKQSKAGGRASTRVVEATPNEPPARPPDPDETTETPWHAQLRGILKTLPLGTEPDDAIFQRIAAPLTAELLPQFAVEAAGATEIRKWAGYEAIAKQVGARGVVNGKTAPAEESYFKRRAQELVESRKRGGQS